MNTTNIRNTRYLHNGDYSGDTSIRDGSGNEVMIPTEDLLDYVAQIVASRRIAALEQATCREIFGINFNAE